jgi:hypothetical protein
LVKLGFFQYRYGIWMEDQTMTIKPKYPCPLTVIVNTVIFGPKPAQNPFAGLVERIIGPNAQPAMAPVQRKPFFLHGRFERED